MFLVLWTEKREFPDKFDVLIVQALVTQFFAASTNAPIFDLVHFSTITKPPVDRLFRHVNLHCGGENCLPTSPSLLHFTLFSEG